MSGASIAPQNGMNAGLTHFGASDHGAAFAAVSYASVLARKADAVAATDRMRAEAARAVQPAIKALETPAQIRSAVMAERGVDARALANLGAQARIEAEISINTETARRARQAQIRTTGNYVDLRI